MLSYDSDSNGKGFKKKGANSFVISNKGSDSEGSADLSFEEAPVMVEIVDQTE